MLSGNDGLRLQGCTTALQDDESWIVAYTIELDAGWNTRRADVTSQSAAGSWQRRLESDGAGRWLVDGAPAPELDGCFDVDLESSAMTNALPVHRANMGVGVPTPAPAAYVRAPGLAVGRLEQVYVCASDAAGKHRYDYAAPAFDFRTLLVYDRSGLVLDYPGIAVRSG